MHIQYIMISYRQSFYSLSICKYWIHMDIPNYSCVNSSSWPNHRFRISGDSARLEVLLNFLAGILTLADLFIISYVLYIFSNVFSQSHLPLSAVSLSRNPIDPNWLISDVWAMTRMRSASISAIFWRKLISRNKDPSVFSPRWSEFTLPLELALPPPSPHRLFTVIIALIYCLQTSWTPLCCSLLFVPSTNTVDPSKWNKWMFYTRVYWITTHRAHGTRAAAEM